MSGVTCPAFIAVLPAEVGRYGAAASIVLAHIRYRTGTAGADRIEHDGYRWWRVTLGRLAEETGLTVKGVRTALGALDGVVLANHFPPLKDQSRAYRVAPSGDALTSQLPDRAAPDLPVARAGTPDAPTGTDRAPTGTPPCPTGHLHLYLENLEEGEEGGRGDAAPPAADEDTPPANGKPATPEPQPMGDDPPEDLSRVAEEPASSAAANAAPPDLMALPLPPIHWPAGYPEPEPPRRCPKHADHEGWVQEPCPPCGDADRAHKAWEATRAAWRKERAHAIQAWIATCDQCDEAGWLMDDPEDKLPAVKCLHAPNAMAWSKLHPNWRQEGPAATQCQRAS